MTYACYVQFTAKPEERSALAALLMQAAKDARKAKGCLQYDINLSVENGDDIWVTERWKSEADQKAALQLPSVPALIQQVMPLLAGMPKKIDLTPLD